MGKGNLRAYGNKRDISEASIVEVLRKAGCSVIRLDKPVDLLVGFRGNTYLVEIKTAKGKLTKAQDAFRTSWRGDIFYIIRDVDGALNALKLWGALRSDPLTSRLGREAA